MNRKQLERAYEDHGLKNYQLQSTEDLLEVHGIDFTDVEGYEELSDGHKQEYANFIVYFFNAQGLDSRLQIVPKAVYYADEVSHLIKQDEGYLLVATTVKSINKDGSMKFHSEWKDSDYKSPRIVKRNRKRYLRFEYRDRAGLGWLHVEDNGGSWH